MGIDPYTGNPLVQRRLEDLAWASVAGGVPVSVATGAVSGVAGTMLTVTRRLDSLVWDLSPTEIREHLEPRLTARGNSPKIAREFLRNTTFTPTLQLLFVDALEPLGTIKGEEGLLKIAIGSRSEAHALFLIQQLRMIRRHAGNDPVRELIALEQSVVARLRSGRRVLALPVDYLSWTARVAGARRPRETGQGGARAHRVRHSVPDSRERRPRARLARVRPGRLGVGLSNRAATVPRPPGLQVIPDRWTVLQRYSEALRRHGSTGCVMVGAISLSTARAGSFSAVRGDARQAGAFGGPRWPAPVPVFVGSVARGPRPGAATPMSVDGGVTKNRSRVPTSVETVGLREGIPSYPRGSCTQGSRPLRGPSGHAASSR